MTCCRFGLVDMLEMRVLHHEILKSSWPIIDRWSLIGKSSLHELLIMAKIIQIIEVMIAIVEATRAFLLLRAIKARAVECSYPRWGATRCVDGTFTALMRFALILNQVRYVGWHIEQLIRQGWWVLGLRYYLVHSNIDILCLLHGWMVLKMLTLTWRGRRAWHHLASHAHAMTISLRKLLMRVMNATQLLIEWMMWGGETPATHARMGTVTSIASCTSSWMIAFNTRLALMIRLIWVIAYCIRWLPLEPGAFGLLAARPFFSLYSCFIRLVSLRWLIIRRVIETLFFRLLIISPILILKKSIFILFELFLSRNGSSSMTPKIPSIVQIDVKIVHSSSTSITVYSGCYTINIRVNIKANNASANRWTIAALMVLSVRSGASELIWACETHAWWIEVQA